MLRCTDYVKEFINGNLNIKYDSDTIEAAKKDEFLTFSDILFWVDCYIIGNEYCLSNYEMGFSVYNLYSDLWYIVSFSDLEKLKDGKSIKLYARKVDSDVRKQMKGEGF